MCGELYHSVCDCWETKFLMYLGICYLDTSDQVFMTDGSALPQAEGEGGVAHVIRDSLTPDPESFALSTMESNILSIEYEIEPRVLVPESKAYADSFNYGEISPMMCSSTNDYVNDFMSDGVKEGDGYPCCGGDQPREELQAFHLATGSESIHLNSRMEHSHELELEKRTPGDGNRTCEFKPYDASGSEPLLSPCVVDRVVMSNGLELPLSEGSTCPSRVIQEQEAFCTATPALIDSESTCPSSINTTSCDPQYETIEGLVDWIPQESSAFADLSEFMETSSVCPSEERAPMFLTSVPLQSMNYSTYNYIDDINDFEEEGEINSESHHLSPSSLVPDALYSSYEVSDSSLTNDSSAMMHLESQESEITFILLKSESLIESELGPLSSSFELDHLFHASNKSQRPSVHSARAKNMEIIHASLRRSNMNFDEGVERCAQYDVCVHSEEAASSISQVSSRDLCNTLIQHVQRWYPGYPMRIAKLKHALASSYEFSTTISVPWTSRIDSPSHSMCIHSGSDLNIEDMWQVPELALVYDASWMAMSIPVLDMSLECVSWSFSTTIN